MTVDIWVLDEDLKAHKAACEDLHKRNVHSGPEYEAHRARAEALVRATTACV